MYIITLLDILSNSVKIVEVFKNEIDAINHLHKEASTLSQENMTDVIILPLRRIEVYQRNYGWVKNYKDLIYVYQLLEHKESSCVCAECNFNDI